MNIPTIMVPTGEEEKPSAVQKEMHEESTDEVDHEVQETTTTTTESLELPSCRDGSIGVEADATAMRQDSPPLIMDDLNMDKEEEKKRESHGKVLRDDTHCQEMMHGTAQSSTHDSFLLPPQEGKQTPHQLLQHNNSSASNTPHNHQQQQQLPTTTPSKRASRPHPSKRSPNPDHSRSNTCLPTPTPPAAAITATAVASRRRTKGGKTSNEHGTTSGTVTTTLQGVNTQTSVQQHSAESSTRSTNINNGQQNTIRASGFTPLTSQLQMQQNHQRQQQRHERDRDNECGASSVTTLSLSDQPGAFRIYPHGPDGVHSTDDNDTLMFHDGDIAAASSNRAPAPVDYTAAVSPPEEVLPMAQTLEDDDLEKEVLERVRSRQPVVQAESIPLPPASSSMKGWTPWVVVLVVLISAVLLVTLSGMGVLSMNRPSSMTTAAPSIVEDAPVDIRPVVQWLEPFLTNRSFTIPSDSSSAQYRAIEWLSQQEQASNVTTEAELHLWVQSYVLVTLYYSTGGDTGTWGNDRLWLSTEPLCDWALIRCSDHSIDDNDDGVLTATDGDKNGEGNETAVITVLDLRTFHVVFYFWVDMCTVLLTGLLRDLKILLLVVLRISRVQ
jgi:hypothetical protein